MFVEIKFPKRCSTVEKKQEFINELIEWGIENLNDQKEWEYKTLLCIDWSIKISHIIDTTESISFNIENEADAMAIKLTWCET